jgi:hypothetical protein
MLNKHGSWESVSYDVSIGRSLGLSEVEVVDYFFDPVPDNSWDGAHEQGHEGDVYMVFKYQDRFFRVSGHSNSYGSLYWDHGIKEVYPKRVEKIVYEYTFEKED